MKRFRDKSDYIEKNLNTLSGSQVYHVQELFE